MLSVLLPSMLLLGLASGLHCVGMCGGIVTAFSSRAIILSEKAQSPQLARQLAFNLGRIASYALAGALAGSIGSAGAYVAGVLPAQTALLVLANFVLILIGMQLTGVASPLARMEALGAPLWRVASPYAERFFGARSLPHAVAAGAAWGWLPCGLVYGALAAAVFAGSPARGALAMTAFGLGTLPWLLAAGVTAARLRALPGLRVGIGVLVAGFGLWGLARAAMLNESLITSLLCL